MSVPAYQPFSPLGIPQKQQENIQYSAWNPLGWYSSINSYRQRLNLPNPGRFERLHFETKGGFRQTASFRATKQLRDLDGF
jgi:mitochondrial import receptor subunit TOM40